jgi:Flp pilus assembly protein TadG
VQFLALVFTIIVTAPVFFASQALETAATDSTRLILTGQAQTQGLTQGTFKDAVCTKVYELFDCMPAFRSTCAATILFAPSL